MVALCKSTPIGVYRFDAFLIWADSVHPMIIVGKASARPAQHGNAKLPERIDHILADPLNIGYRRIISNPKTPINASAQMLRKMPVDISVYPAYFSVGIYNDL
jgi:hypothetical protein